MISVPLVNADAVAKATKTLAYVTGALGVVTLVLAIATIVLVCVTRRGMKSAHDDTERLINATNDQVEATRAAAKNEIDAMREATEREIAAAHEAAARQVESAQQQIDAEHLPFLIEVLPTGPIFGDMGARPNPNIVGSPQREVPLTVPLAFENAREVEEVDPRQVFVRIERGMVFVSLPLRNVGRGLAIIDTQSIELTGSPWIGGNKAFPRAQPERVPTGETTRIYVLAEYRTVGDHQQPTRMTIKDRWRLRVPFRDFAWQQPSAIDILIGFRGDGAAVGDWYVYTVRASAPRPYYRGDGLTPGEGE